ncbi:hypothetical protein U9M48_034780 [Paspalum notatum var. saurae]|uniref:Uncharacterized protein n=1 Tax=Paspalum notatum var. saurae TaxID=547442 RepID=A0AAQ3UDD9_PASNO
MAGRRNRSRRRRRRAKLDSEASESSSPQSSGSSNSDDRTAQRKIPLSDRQQQPQITEEEDPQPDLGRRRTRDARAVRRFLLDLIRGYYIDAISRLPTAELRSTLARGLLVGGHCYGPLHPVHNIILNSVWYAAAFPFRATTGSIHVNVITTDGISRLASRSLDGLVAYLCHQCPALSHEDAIWHLGLSHGTLHGAAASARGAVLPFGRRMELLETVPMQVAAQAARHPQASALGLFATSVLPADTLSLLAGKRRLSSHDVMRLSAMLQPLLPPDVSLPPPQPYPRELSVRISRIIAERRAWLRIWYQTLVDIADAALRKFARRTGARYCLHTIYGQCSLRVGEFCLQQCIHINFMAWPKGNGTHQTPARFFVEAYCPPARNCSEEHITFCCMLEHAQPSPSRADNCYACAMTKRKIDHPDGEEHFGGHPHETGETKDHYDFPPTIDVDYRFFDPDRDMDLVKWYADTISCADSEPCSEPRSKNDRVNRAAAAGSCGKFYEGYDSDEVNDEDSWDDDLIAKEDIETYCTICV